MARSRRFLPAFLFLGLAVSGLSEERAGIRKTDTPKLNSERIEERFGSYGIEVLEHAPVRVSKLYSIHGEEKICRTFAIVSFTEPAAKDLQPALTRIKAGASLGATLKKAGWKVEKEPLHIGTIPAGPRFRKLAKLEQSPDLAVSIYRLHATREEVNHEVATVIEIHHPEYLDEQQLRELHSSVWHQEQIPIEKLRELLRLATAKMENAETPSISR